MESEPAMIRRVIPAVFLVSIVLGSFTPVGFGAEPSDWRRELSQPGPEFSQMPFWFWNDELSNEEIGRQMAEFRRQGVFGFVIHARMGLSKEIPYLGSRWLGHVRFAVEEAARTGMRVCLYDEAMYPSGSAHGAVVKSNPAFAAQGLAVRCEDVTGPTEIKAPEALGRRVATVLLRQNGRQLELDGAQVIREAASTIRMPAGSWRMMTFSAEPSGGHIRGVHFGEDDGQPGAPAAADLLNVDAMKAFLRLAYEPYAETLKDHFGKTVIGIFTDEPSFLGRGPRKGLQPWTTGLAEDFQQRRGYDLLPVLPALFFDVGPQTAKIRGDFHRTLAERLDASYYQQLSEWCARHGIALTGHPAESDEIRPLRLFQIPAQDMVWRWVLPGSPTMLEGANSTVAKCSSSVARHDGRRLNGNEIYGAYGWQLTMDEMKGLADWLTVRGVNLFYPHAFYFSLSGPRAFERPPELGIGNAWWPHYRLFADYTSRLCWLQTDSRQVCNVAVLSVNNHLPWRAAAWLLQNQVDFNYLEDWRLMEQARVADGKLNVGPMSYRLLVVDQDEPLADAVVQRVKAFETAGGMVRFCREAPSPEMIAGLERDVRLDPPSTDLRYAHLVKSGVHFYLLTNEGEQPIETTLACRCLGKAEWFDPWANSYQPAAVGRLSDATMELPLRLQRRESRVLIVDPRQPATVTTPSREPVEKSPAMALAGPWKITDAAGKAVGDRLGDWKELPVGDKFTGTLRYQTVVTLTKDSQAKYQLDLGTVGDWAVVHVNGKSLGPRFWAPMAWDITDSLRDGPNELVVEVTNSLAAKYDPKHRRPSGLFGPVKIHIPGRGIDTGQPAN
jgi:hypothetical protein